MKVYAVRKRAGLWAVCSDEKVVLNFDSYEQAIDTARSALGVLSRVHDDAERKLRGQPSCAQKTCEQKTCEQTCEEEIAAREIRSPKACEQ